MPAFQRFPVSVSYKQKTYNSNQAFDTTEEVVVIDNKMMCIERMPYNRIFQILGQQKNAKATYVLYLELNDPNLPQEADVIWEMYGQKYSGKVKFTQPYARVVMNRKGEAYIQSDNE